MARRSLKHLILATENEGVEEVPQELHDEPELAQLEATDTSDSEEVVEADAQIEKAQELTQVLEALRDDADVSPETVTRIMQLYRGSVPNTISLESFHSDEDLELALEGVGSWMRDKMDSVLQHSVLSYKHVWNASVDLLKSNETLVKKYGDKLRDTGAEYSKKKGDFREGDHHMSLMNLWYFFSNAKGFTKNIISDLAFDTAASRYILVDFQGKVNQTLGKLNDIMRSAKLKDDAEVKKLLDQVEKFPTLAELYGTKYLGDKILFNATSVVVKKKSKMPEVVVGGKAYRRLPELMGTTAIEESRSALHTAHKVLVNAPSAVQLVGQFATYASLPTARLTTEEIGKLIKFGEDYIKNAEDYLNLQRKSLELLMMAESAWEKLTDNADSQLKDRKALLYVLRYSENLSKALLTPSSRELARTIRGAKYCNYIALRMIYNASKYIG